MLASLEHTVIDYTASGSACVRHGSTQAQVCTPTYVSGEHVTALSTAIKYAHRLMDE